MFFCTIHMFIFAWFLLVMAILTLGEPIFVGYYSLWRQDENKNVDLSKYTHINLSFAIPEEDGSIKFNEKVSIPDIVKHIHSKGPKALVSVGGWTGSKRFSTIVADKTKKEKFISEITELVKTNKLDGIDIDWEYPGQIGLHCNDIDYENDAPNFLNFLKQLRKEFNNEFGKDKKLITLAVPPEPFFKNKKPFKKIGKISKQVDYASIMLFDIQAGGSMTTGPNAPLKNELGLGHQYSVDSAIESWTSAKWPAEKLVIGLSFYGRSLTALEKMSNDNKGKGNMYQPKERKIPQGDWEDVNEKADSACGVLGGYTGIWTYKHLRQSILTGPEKANKDWTRNWDTASKTPWLFNPGNKTFITYDDPPSIANKVKFAAEKGLAGAMAWAIDKDYKGELVAAMRSWAGGEYPVSKPGDSDKDDTGKDDTGKDDTGKDDTGKDDTGKDDTGKDDTGKDDTGKDDTGKDDTGNNGSGKDDTDNNKLNEESPAEDDSGDNNSEDTGKNTCSTEGQLACTASGNSPEYTVCIYKKPVKMQCGGGTVCVTINGSIYCGWKPPVKNRG
ncbi:hypothetical protein COEREDRAFT_88761 [Coemansia reversa NRRL 1564]|uniref:GH18 domain-containing protein n=1 Tax=Coemansia reversa (strain ATCC 12441 / NRRL 1564) TaxID=763665 RepID=A0A2G5B5U8_COERN|nr:hypothetical protein COEREDRAFT_88761 [Coemansia reversa NRRL 1564]|eukprot:PIA14371.1 hypothetical protein COEREDRAFT_88761 [Coemansia reversa NRRL 1564]